MSPSPSNQPQAAVGSEATGESGDAAHHAIGTLVTGRFDDAAIDHERLLLGELSHRVKNTLTVVLAIVRRSSRRHEDVPGFVAGLEGRLHALAIAHELLAASSWRAVSLLDLTRRVLAPELRKGRIVLAIGSIDIQPSLAQTLVMVLHELLDNAVRHGGLVAPAGRVRVQATVEAGDVELVWEETGGAPPAAVVDEGFGITMLTRAVPHQHGGHVDLNWRPEGLLCRLHIPLAHPDVNPG